MLEWVCSNSFGLSTQDSDVQERILLVQMCQLLITWPMIERASWSTVPSSVHAVGTDSFSGNSQRKVKDWKGTTALKLNPNPKPQTTQLRESQPQPSFFLFYCYSHHIQYYIPLLQYNFSLWFSLQLHSFLSLQMWKNFLGSFLTTVLICPLIWSIWFIQLGSGVPPCFLLPILHSLAHPPLSNLRLPDSIDLSSKARATWTELYFIKINLESMPRADRRQWATWEACAKCKGLNLDWTGNGKEWMICETRLPGEWSEIAGVLSQRVKE